MKLNVCLAGASGWVGKALSLEISKTEDLQLSGAVSRTYKGKNLREILSASTPDLIIRESVAEALNAPTDVLADYTKADIVKSNVWNGLPARPRNIYRTGKSSTMPQQPSRMRRAVWLVSLFHVWRKSENLKFYLL